jgi:hypothetical protein
MTGRSLPEDWQPRHSDVAYGYDLGLSYAEIGGIAEDLRLWAAANANRQIARKANWSAAFRGWMRREAAKRKAHNGRATGHDAVMVAFDNLIARAKDREGQDGFTLLDLIPRGPSGR